MLANGVIESVHFDAFVPDGISDAGMTYAFKLRHVALRELTTSS